MDAKTLMTTAIPPTRYIVEGLIPQGLHVLAGAPKVGKSFLTLWMCIRISKGEPIWDYKTNPCSTLYISLEDTPERIKQRITGMAEEFPENMHLSTHAETLDDGLLEQLEAFVKEHPDTGFIAIDTLQKVRSMNTSGQNPYAADYNALAALKRFADSHKLALLLVHHLRKAKSNDPFEMISGTTGITGAVDTSYVLAPEQKRGAAARLYATGRDIIYQEIDIHFLNGVWHLVERRTHKDIIAENFPSELSMKIIQLVIENKGWKGTATQLLFLLEMGKFPVNMVTKHIRENMEHLAHAGISMRMMRSGGTRFVIFELDEERSMSFEKEVLDGLDILAQAERDGYALSKGELNSIRNTTDETATATENPDSSDGSDG
jgi:hypothetical protein